MSDQDFRDGYYKGKEIGQMLEQKRIIKLLEDIHYLSDCCIQPDCCITTSELITLIKGENK